MNVLQHNRQLGLPSQFRWGTRPSINKYHTLGMGRKFSAPTLLSANHVPLAEAKPHTSISFSPVLSRTYRKGETLGDVLETDLDHAPFNQSNIRPCCEPDTISKVAEWQYLLSTGRALSVLCLKLVKLTVYISS